MLRAFFVHVHCSVVLLSHYECAVLLTHLLRLVRVGSARQTRRRLSNDLRKGPRRTLLAPELELIALKRHRAGISIPNKLRFLSGRLHTQLLGVKTMIERELSLS